MSFLDNAKQVFTVAGVLGPPSSSVCVRVPTRIPKLTTLSHFAASLPFQKLVWLIRVVFNLPVERQSYVLIRKLKLQNHLYYH